MLLPLGEDGRGSYLACKASIGFIFDALRAGMKPAIAPAMIMTIVARMQTSMPTVGSWKY